MRGSIIVVDDEEATADALRDILGLRGFTAKAVYSAAACLEQLNHVSADVVMTDVQMPGGSGIELCARLRQDYPELVSIVLTGAGGFDVAVAAMRAGAFDYLSKPVAIDALDVAVARALGHVRLRREVERLRTVSVRPTAIEGIAGESPAIQNTIELVRRIAPSDATVLITGESGTGKELVARALHQLSPRKESPFVGINCAAMPAPLLESELFGHVRGAFTDAREPRPGLFVQAGDGTIFLDELGETTLDMQVKLLRVLQERVLRPVGSDTEVPFGARVVASTNRNLEREVVERRFREDLYYRINVVEIPVPPLRDRGSDVTLLAQFFLRRIAARCGKPVRGLTPEAAGLLLGYDWPGNVRELENCMERAVALCQYDRITVDDLPAKLHAHARAELVFEGSCPDDLLPLAEVEGRYIRHVLAAVRGNRTRAARVLGIDRRSLYRRLAPLRDALPDPEPITG